MLYGRRVGLEARLHRLGAPLASGDAAGGRVMAQLDLTYEACAHRIPLPVPLNLSPTERALVENTWRGRMLNEHASARVFAGLLTQLMAAGSHPAVRRRSPPWCKMSCVMHDCAPAR